MNPILFISAFLGLAIIYAIIGLRASRGISSVTDYFLASRNLGLFSVTCTLIATQIGGGMLLGTAQEAYTYGLLGIMYTLGMCAGFLLLGCFFAPVLQSLKVNTVAELFQTRYNSPTLKKIASLLSIATMTGILIAQVVASKKFLASLGFSHESAFIIFWILTIAYTAVGGLKAVVITDIYQALFIVIIFSGLFCYSIFMDPASLNCLLPTNISLDSISLQPMIAALLMPMLFSLIEQDLAQRFFASKSAAIARMSAFLSALFMILFACIPIYFGIQARTHGVVENILHSPLMPMIETFASEIFVILAACGVIAAITSTADSLLCAIGSNIAQDFDFTWLAIPALTRSQYIVWIIGIGTLIASYFTPQNTITILTSSYELSVSCLLVPLLFCYYSTQVKKEAAIGAIIAGLLGFFGFRMYDSLTAGKEIFTLLFSLIGYGIGNRIK